MEKNIVKKSSLIALAKFLSVLFKSESHAIEIVNRYQEELNSKSKITVFEVKSTFLVAPEQAISTLKSIYFNLLYVTPEVEADLLEEINSTIKEIENRYSINQKLYENCLLG